MAQINCIAYCVLILLIVYIQLNYAFYFIAGFVLLCLVFFQCSKQPHLVSSPLKYRMTIFLANVLCLTTCMLIFSRAGDHEITSFIIDVLPKLFLVHCSSSAQSFAAVVLEYLRSSDDGDTESLSE